MDELLQQHKKEIKALEEEKRFAIKKSKNTGGKKSKDTISSLEHEYQEKLINLQQRHQGEIEALQQQDGIVGDGVQPEQDNNDDLGGATDRMQQTIIKDDIGTNQKTNKKLAKREKQKEKQRQRQQEEAEAAAAAATTISPRQMEYDAIVSSFDSHYTIVDIPADGHCLYRAVSSQLNRHANATNNNQSYQDMRNLCADTLLRHRDEFASFVEETDYEAYVRKVRSDPDCWGGHVEIMALSLALRRCVDIYSTQHLHPHPLRIDARAAMASSSTTPSSVAADDDNVGPIRLSYHYHYYALGEHYNEVIPK